MTQKKKKQIFKTSKKNGLSKTVECNLIDFLDVTFDLKSGTTYRKPNNELRYINKHSDHPLSIANQMPSIINNGVPENCCDKNYIDKAALYYNMTLKKVDLIITSHIFQVKPKKLEREKLFGSNLYIESANEKTTLVKFS